MSSKKTRWLSVAALSAGLVCLPCPTHAQDRPDPEKPDADFPLQGEYSGTIPSRTGRVKMGVQVIALGDGAFQAVYYTEGLPGDGWNKKDPERIDGTRENQQVVFQGKKITGSLAKGVLRVARGNELFGELAKVHRKSKTLGQRPAKNAVVLFDGTSAEGFVSDRGGPAKMTEDGLLTRGANSKHLFGDCHLHVEFRLPYEPKARGQGRGNSGVYLQGRYEVQVLDSFGLTGESNECGGIYGLKKPDLNMCYPPLSWQTYDVGFTAAKYDDQGKKKTNARFTVWHNGVLIHDNVELPNPTPVAPLKESIEKGFLHLQDHGNLVRYRNIWLLEK